MPYSDIRRIAGSEDDFPSDDAPETPTDEPTPAPVQDPPAEPDPTPYVVGRHATWGIHSENSP